MSKNKMNLSYSALVKLCKNPRQFHKEYILGEREILEKSYFKKGGLFHLFVLEPENFDEKFVLLPGKLPTDSVQQVIRDVWESYKLNSEEEDRKNVELTDFNNEILAHLKEINLYQSYKTDKQRLDKVACDEGKLYFTTLRDADNYKKVIVDTQTVEEGEAKATIMLQNEWIKEMLTETGTAVVRKEIELEAELKNYSFNLKGIIDLLKVDYENETIHIIDFKTTSKSIEQWRANFLESEYLYWLQMMIYKELVLGLVPEDSKTAWTFKIWFPVIDKDNQVYIFPVSANTLHESQLKTLGVFDIADWHIKNGEYDLPYNYAKGIVEL
jgi:hypothetical protein